MGKRVERSMDWMDNVATLIEISSRKGSEHTVSYFDKEHNHCVVRVPAAFTAFLEMYLGLMSKPKLKRVA
jgi:hypothetical protein